MSTTGHDPTDPRFAGARVGTPIPLAAGIPVLVPEPKAHAYSTNPPLGLWFSPVQQGISVSIAVGAGPVAVALVGSEIQVSALLPGTTTYVNLLAAWNAAPGVLAAAVLTGDAGTFPVGYLGLAATALATIRPSNADGMVGLCTDGVWRPVRLTTDGSIEVSVTIGDAIKAYQYVSVASATPTQVAGTPGRINQDVAFTIDAGMTATAHPLVGGVSVAITTAAAAAVAAIGKAVTLTAKNAPALTDITAMNVLIAASPTVSALIGPLTGVGADTFDAAVAIAATPLWESGTIAAGAKMILGNDGYLWLSERDATGGEKVSQSSLGAGEDLTNDVQKVEHRYSYASGAAQAQVKATAGFLHTFRCNCTTAGTITIYDNPAEAGTAIDAIPMAIGAYMTHIYDVSAGTGLYIGFDATWAGSWNASYR